MKDGPNIVSISSLVGDHARASMLTALMTGEALTATELSVEANITKQTASSHLAKLVDAGLIAVTSQGRHRYFRLAAPDVAQLLESLMGIAERTGARRYRPGPRDPALRKARVCYDHLAGDMGVLLYEALLQNDLIHASLAADAQNPELELTLEGTRFFQDLQIDIKAPGKSRRRSCRPCLDWSVRRFHLAGALGSAVLQYCYRKKLARRVEGSRVVGFTPRGEKVFRQTFGIVSET